MKNLGICGRMLATGGTGVAILLTGCPAGYDGPPRAEVSGTVTWKGEPVEGGTINFFPASQGTGRPTGTTILGGKYKIEEAKGPEMGQYKVLINWSKRPPGSEANLDAPLVEQIPTQFNNASTLTVTIDKSPQEINYALPE